MQSIFEQAGGTYRQNENYLIPDLSLPAKGYPDIGMWGRRNKRYLQDQHPVLYMELLLQNLLWDYLADINIQARVRLHSEMEKPLLFWNVDEALKARDPMG